MNTVDLRAREAQASQVEQGSLYCGSRRESAIHGIVYMPGDYRGEATPVPIPNTEVKLSNADGTAFVVGE